MIALKQHIMHHSKIDRATGVAQTTRRAGRVPLRRGACLTLDRAGFASDHEYCARAVIG